MEPRRENRDTVVVLSDRSKMGTGSGDRRRAGRMEERAMREAFASRMFEWSGDMASRSQRSWRVRWE